MTEKITTNKINKKQELVKEKCEISNHHNHNKDKLNNAFKDSIIKNKWFYLTLFICFSIFKLHDVISPNQSPSPSSSSSYFTFIFSFIFILIFGHITHRLSHNIDFTKVYNNNKKGNMNVHVDSLLSNVCSFLDFHRKTHHDSDVNKKPINIFYEFMNNFLTQGGIFIIFIWFCNTFIDMRVILLWALMYASAHNINYMFIKPTVHKDHHLHEDTNYGLDIADIIFDTKYDLNDIEDHNHISINLIIITFIITYFNMMSSLFVAIKQCFLVLF